MQSRPRPSGGVIQHSAHIPPGRDGLFDLVRALPNTLRYENSLIFVNGVHAMLHGRFSGHGRPRAWVVAGIRGVFIDRDPSILDRLFAENDTQHNPTIPNGTAAIKGLLPKLPADFSYTPGLAVAEGDFVMIHGRYVGWGPKPMIGVDIFRVENGKIAEHWDVLQEELPATRSANGNPMFEAP